MKIHILLAYALLIVVGVLASSLAIVVLRALECSP